MDKLGKYRIPSLNGDKLSLKALHNKIMKCKATSWQAACVNHICPVIGCDFCVIHSRNADEVLNLIKKATIEKLKDIDNG
jgi:hypothetical protein